MTGGMDEDTAPAVDEELLAEIPVHSTDVLTVLDTMGQIRYVSPSIERVFGYQQAELLDTQAGEFFHPDDRDRVLAAFEAVVSSDSHRVETTEYRHALADGGYCWAESSASTNPTSQGYYVVNTQDISARKRREQELRRKNEQLDQFASVVSHDLRNPLSVAQGYLEIAAEAAPSDALDTVATALDRMELLIEDLLALARAGSRIDEPEPVDLAVLAADCWQNVSTGDARLVVAIDRRIRADRSRLEQLLENLLRNSVEHSGEEVTVTIGGLDSGDGIYVADDGPGIDADSRDRVFERGYSSTRGGTGFGLAIVAEIAEAHGWSVAVTESETGGARFELTGVEFT